MRVLAIVHQRDAGPGVFADATRARGARLDTWLGAETAAPPADPAGYDAVMTFGGAMHADHEGEHPWLREEKALLAELLEGGVPVLGVCLGSQLLAEAAGGSARRARRPEIGWHEVTVTAEGAADPLLAPLSPAFTAFQWHSYEFSLPPGATALARSATCLQAFRLGGADRDAKRLEHRVEGDRGEERRVEGERGEERRARGLAWGIQFLAEVSAADAEAWIDDYRSDEDAVALGLDPEALRRQTREAIGEWSEVGRALCERFLDAAGAQTRR